LMSSDTYETQKGYHRNSKGDDAKPKDSVVAAEIRSLLKEPNDYKSLNELRLKYNNEELVQQIFDGYKERTEYLKKKAIKFKQLIFYRYNGMNLSYPELLKKARKYKDKYKLSDDEFDLFVKLSLSDTTFNTTNIYNIPNTAMSKTLGYTSSLAMGEKLRVKDNELDVLDDILKIYAATKPLHEQVIVQSRLYRDCAPEAITGEYNKAKYNPYSYVHPILAAMFIPRIDYLDEHMLLASLSNIVKTKYENKAIVTKPEFEVYWDLITDQNDSACTQSRDTPLTDLRNRIHVQIKIWESVLNLRQGRYYNERLGDFMSTLDKCASNIFDSPDQAYVKDEGAILRRLLGVFSIKPTIVTVSPLYGLASNSMVNPASITQVTTLPMITLKLPPPQLQNTQNTNVAVHLDQALEQAQWYYENKMLVPKQTSIVHSRNVLFFYVSRRFQHILMTSFKTPFCFNELPITATGLERINDRLVNYNNIVTLATESYELRSVVLVERSITNQNVIIGSTAAIRIPQNFAANRFVEGCMVYDPQGCAIPVLSSAGVYQTIPPISYIAPDSPFNAVPGDESFKQRASTCGTIFIYVKSP
jgi:hypothetical protein